MKIVFIGPFGLQPKGTMSMRALPLAKALVARGHTVTLLIPPWDDPERVGQIWTDEDVQVINVPLPGRWPLLFHILLTHALVRQALALQPDVVHVFKPKAYSGLAHFFLWWLRRLRGLPVRLVLDCDDWEQAWNDVSAYSAAQKFLFAWQEQWGLRYADSITVASRALQILAASYAGDKPVFYVPNGCCTGIFPGLPAREFDLSLGQTAQDRHSSMVLKSQLTAIRQKWDLGDAPTILLYSRFLEFKPARIVTQVKLVADRLPQARWLIVGCGLNGEEKSLARLLEQAHLEQFVRFAGWQPPEQLFAFFRVADVAVFPYDNTLINRTKCSVKLIDLLSAGVPIVADAVGQNCEYIESGVSGILVPVEDDVAFAESLAMLLQHPELRRKLGQAAAKRVAQDFAWSGLSQIVEEAYA